jgi:2-oxoglutarate dehydrogenase complex dehydrogenase (E1) component-like enzyme
MYANVNPLHAPSTKMPVQLFGFTESDVVSHEALREVAPGIAKRVRGKVDIATLVNHLQAIYCGTTSVEYDGLNEKERQWLSEAVERSTRDEFATPGFFLSSTPRGVVCS